MNQRVLGYDLARALAIFGMVIVNFNTAMQATVGSKWYITLVKLLEGRAAATFVILAGVGVSLMVEKARRSGNSDMITKKRILLLKRSLFLFLIGLALSTIWPADILHFYAVYFVIGALLLTASDRALWFSSALFVAVGVVLLLFFDYEKGWNWETLDYIDLWSFNGLIRHIFFNGFHPVFPWAAFLMIGMWLGRRNLLDSGVRNPLMIASLTIWVVVEFLSGQLIGWFLLNSPGMSSEDVIAIFGTSPIPPMPQYIVSGGAFAIFIITFCVSFSNRFANARWLTPLYQTGQLALTFYIFHILFGIAVLDELGMLQDQSVNFAVQSAMIFNLSGMLLTVLWKKKFSAGPFEWCFKKLTAN